MGNDFIAAEKDVLEKFVLTSSISTGDCGSYEIKRKNVSRVAQDRQFHRAEDSVPRVTQGRLY